MEVEHIVVFVDGEVEADAVFLDGELVFSRTHMRLPVVVIAAGPELLIHGSAEVVDRLGTQTETAVDGVGILDFEGLYNPRTAHELPHQDEAQGLIRELVRLQRP